MDNHAQSRWLIRRTRRPEAAVNLYCFPHAGGSPGEYVRWSDELPAVQVWAVQLPGRASRLAEPPFTRMAPLVEAIAAAVTFEPPFALFGHSLGGLIAFEVARALRKLGQEPDQLFLSSCPPPPLATTRPAIHALPDEQLLVEIERRWGPLPPQVHADPELRTLVLGCHRADLEIFETYRYTGGEPLRCPITAFAGDQEGDDLRTQGWLEHTVGRFETRFFPGHHFYLRERRGELLRVMGEALSARGTANFGTGAGRGAAPQAPAA